MPFDGVFTNSITKELLNYIDGRIEKIHQPSKEEIVIFIKKERLSAKILFSANPSYPRVHFTGESKQNPQTPPTFCMILRKHLSGGRLIDIRQINFDRIIEIEIESKDELGYPVNYYLVSEIMGKHSNIILLNNEKVIVDCVKHIGSNINRYREVVPGAQYKLPPESGKTNPLLAVKSELESLLNRGGDTSTANFFTNNFLGISKTFSLEICRNLSSLKINELSLQQKEEIISNFFYFIAKIKSGDFYNLIYYKDNDLIDYYAFPLKQYSDLKQEPFDSPGRLLDIVYGEKDLKGRLKQKYHDLFKLVSNLIERNNKKILIHKSKLEECSSYKLWKIYGDLIMANQYIIDNEMEQVELENFYSDELSKVVIPLESGIGPVQNAQKYYKKYNKEKNTIDYVTKQLEESHLENSYLESTLYNLENAQDMETIEEIKLELSEAGYIRRRKTKEKQQKSNPNHYVSSDGFDIYVGKNNIQNDYLTNRFAVSSDIWMHTKNIPGSHVIIKSQNGKVSDSALLEGALFAAYYSKAKGSANVPVDYSEKKNVKKPSGSKPGMVIYYTNKTIYVTPDEEKIKRMQQVK